MKNQKKDAQIIKEIKLNKTDKKLAEKMKKIQQARHLAGKLQKISQWWPAYLCENPDASFLETVKTMRKSINKLLGKNVSINKKKKKQPPLSDIEEKFYSLRSYMMMRSRQIVSPQQQGEFNFPGPILIPPLSDDLFGSFCKITSGVARANALTTYAYHIPERPDTYSDLIFTPRIGLDVTTFAGKFIGGEGISSFLGLTGDLGDTKSTLLVLRVSFPPQSRNVTVFYETNAFIRLSEGCTVFSPWPDWWSSDPKGWLKFEYIIHEQPNGGSYPSFSSFDRYNGLLCGQTNDNDTIKSKNFLGSMQVRAGVISNLYVGVSVQFLAEEDVIVTTGRMEDPGGGQFLIAPPDWAISPGQGYGVYYVMVPAD